MKVSFLFYSFIWFCCFNEAHSKLTLIQGNTSDHDQSFDAQVGIQFILDDTKPELLACFSIDPEFDNKVVNINLRLSYTPINVVNILCLTECVTPLIRMPIGPVINILYSDNHFSNDNFRPLINGGDIFVAFNKFRYHDIHNIANDFPLCSDSIVTFKKGNSVTTLCQIEEFNLNDTCVIDFQTDATTTPMAHTLPIDTTVSTTRAVSVMSTMLPNSTWTSKSSMRTTKTQATTLKSTLKTTTATVASTTLVTVIPLTTKVSTKILSTPKASTFYTKQPLTTVTTEKTTSTLTPQFPTNNPADDKPDIDCQHPISTLFEMFCNLTSGSVVATYDNVVSIANLTLAAYNPKSDDKNALYALSVIFHDCSKLNDITHVSFDAMSRLLDHAIDTSKDVFTSTNSPSFSVSKRLSSGLFSLLANAPTNASYLSGNNLAFHTHTLDCTQNDAGGISLSSDDTFKLTHNDENELSSIAINGKSACSAGATRVQYTIYRNSKLFLGVSENETSNGVISSNTAGSDLLGSTTASDGFENSCQRGFFRADDIILAATALVKNDNVSIDGVTVVHRAANPNQTMVKIKFKQSHIGVALHGKIKVTFWEVDNRQWSPNTCEVLKEGDFYVSHCTHLTDFTLIVDGTAKDPVLCSHTLTVINDVIVTASIVSLFLLGVFYLIILATPKNAKRLCLKPIMDFVPPGCDTDPFLFIQVTLLLLFFFIFVLFSDGKRLKTKQMCVGVAVIEYILLMANSTLAILQAWRTAKIFTDNITLDKILSFVTKPLVMYSIVVLVPSVLTVFFWLITDGNFFFRHDGFCWIRADYIVPAVIVPMTFLICNAIACFGLFTTRMFPQLSTRIVRGRTSITINNKAVAAKERLARLFISQFTLGVPWVLQYFALFAPTTTTWHYLFVILNGSQGIVFMVAFLFRGISVKRQQNSLWRQRHAARLRSLEALRNINAMNNKNS